MTLRPLYLVACSSLIALIFLCLAWELRLAPIQPGGSWLALKCLPLLAPLFGILRGRVQHVQHMAAVRNLHGRGIGVTVGGDHFHPETLQLDGHFLAQFT